MIFLFFKLSLLLPKAIPSAAACTTRPNVAVHVDFDFDIDELDESRANENKSNSLFF
jgi:hypothetical protein